ncbi:MAG: hypothetical protein P4L90_26180 [Rhodopila sp.]|nr:hypothetical protein [Rhodopila sp.]
MADRADGAAGGATFAVHKAADRSEQRERDTRAADCTLVLAIRTTNQVKRSQAEAILRAAGATEIETIR